MKSLRANAIAARIIALCSLAVGVYFGVRDFGTHADQTVSLVLDVMMFGGMAGYMKWLANTIDERIRWKESRKAIDTLRGEA